jgi:hypothetical protein
VGRLAPLFVLLAMIAGCQVGSTPTPTPVPSPTPHTPVAQTLLQQANVPAGLAACDSSGSFSAYLGKLQTANPTLAQSTSTRWQDLKKAGATDAAISVFAGDPAACAAELGASGSIKSAASLVVAFADEGQADRAWQAGVFGFTPPVPGQAPPGVARGTPTGLGPSSWTYDRSPVRLACWRKSVFVAVVVLANLDLPAFKSATAAVDAHLN